MKNISFNVNFPTKWGQGVCIVGSISELGNWESVLAKGMTYMKDSLWNLTLMIEDDIKEIEYKYILKEDDNTIVEEKTRRILLPDSDTQYIIYNSWTPESGKSPYLSSAFQNCLFPHRNNAIIPSIISDKKIIIEISAPKVKANEAVFLLGNQPSLGNWNPIDALPMQYVGDSLWKIELDANKITFPAEYKFLVIDSERNVQYWETGGNRVIDFRLLEKNEALIISDLIFREERPLWHGAGTVIPVFSLKSEKSFGIGDLSDLKLLVDWCKKTGQSIVQILPMNDTIKDYTWRDSYPYSAISIFALHPVYMSLNELGRLKDKSRNKYYADIQKELNSYAQIDFEKVLKYKFDYLHEYFAENKDLILNSGSFQDFYHQNQEWLMPYAAFSYLRDTYHTADFTQWKEYSIYDRLTIKELCSVNSKVYDNIAFYYFLQFILHNQFKEVSEYARANGIILKGDLPIGVNPKSVETWTEPQYFHTDSQAGAPPDDFSVNGQNWGFPTYDWETMESDEFSWWKRRFKKLEDYFDAFRIDHILGFFRIWEIPSDYVQGLCGHFNPALPLSSDEIEGYGLSFNKRRFTNAHINSAFLEELFGEYTEEVMNTYLAQSSEHHYVLKPFCDTQRKIKALFAGKTDTESKTIQDGLFDICNEILFLPDPKNKEKFHPRISANKSFLYKELSITDRMAFDKLYEDFFYHRHNDFWKKIAYRHLTPLVDDTKMLVCGEDLGMIPASVPEVMKKLQILSLEIERMPKKPYVEFEDLSILPYTSVCSTSTHDMSPLRSWWHEDRDKTQRYYNSVLGRQGSAPLECTSDIQKQILQNHLSSKAMLVVIPLQDWMGISDTLKNPDPESERINVPAESNHYWRYKMHLTLEELLRAEDFNSAMRDMIQRSGR